MSKTLKIAGRANASANAERTRQPLRGRNRNNQSAVPVRTAHTESRPNGGFGDKPRAPYGNHPPRRDDNRPQRSFDDKPRSSYGERNDRPPRRDDSERPRSNFSDKPRAPYGDRPPRRDDNRPQRSFDDKPRSSYGERNDRPPRRDDGERPRSNFSDKPRAPYGDRPVRRDGDRPQRSFDDKPRSSYGERNDRPPRRDDGERPRSNFSDKPRAPYGDRPPRRDGDRPQRSFDDKPRSSYGERNDRPPRREESDNLREASTYAASRGREPRATDRDPDAGIRLSKYLTETGVCSRREADHYIEKGWVTVNGKRAVLGLRVLPTDKIQLARQLTAAQEKRMTILIHKPVGFVSGQAEDGYIPAVNLIEPDSRWAGDTTEHELENVHVRGMAPAGRLDIDSTGLLVLTQDGRIAKALIGDKSEIDKEYLVRVEGQLSDEGLALLNHGLELDGIPLRPAQVTWQNEDQLRFVLNEGKKRQIRRMCELVGLEVVGLKRIRIGKITLGDLPVGQWRYLRDDEAF